MSTRRLAMIFGILGAASWPWPASSQSVSDYPTKPIRLVAPFPAGAPFDAVARRLAEAMSQQLKVPVIIDNKPGTGGSLGAGEVARAVADGYTLLITISDPLVSTPAAIKVPYDPQRDFSPIVKIASSAPVLLINTQYKSTNLQELVEEAKAAKQPLTYGSFGPASFPQLVMESFSRRAGIKLTDIPYRGAPPALQDVLANQVALAFTSPAQAAQLLPQGKVRVLAVMGATRSPVLPQVATFSESGFDSYFARRDSWLGLLGPARLPDVIVTRLGETVRSIVREPTFTKWMATLDFVPVTGAAPQFKRDLETDLQAVTKFIREELKMEPGELRDMQR